MTQAEHPSVLQVVRATESVWQIPIPTPTIPPALVTNTYVIASNGQALVVDFGSPSEGVQDAFTAQLATLGVQRVIAVVATHYHRDHTQGILQLARRLEAPLYVHQADLQPLRRTLGLRDGLELQPVPARIRVGGEVDVEILHQPGHTHGHVHILVSAEGIILVADHLSGDGTVWIGPPDGHISAYYAALRQIQNCGCAIAGPGHGPLLADAAAAADAMLARRQARERQIAATLETWRTRDEVFQLVYGDTVQQGTAEVAKRTVTAHLQHLLECGAIQRRYLPGRGFQYAGGNT